MKGDGIPYFSRIILIADTFDAMTKEEKNNEATFTLDIIDGDWKKDAA